MDSLFGITFGDWLKLLRENRFAVNIRHWKRIMAITIISIFNARLKRREKKHLGTALDQTQIKAPIFILGHWRSGTTLLHRLICFDERFAYPNLFQVMNPHTFISREKRVAQYLQNADAQKRPMDNVQINPLSPEEHEWAILTLSLRSPLLSWSFPHRAAHYDRYLTFREVPEEDVVCWKTAFTYFMKKLTLGYGGRPLILKSPADTGRIRLLLELFPDARFINIYRDPYTVFSSTQMLYTKAVVTSYLQRPNSESIDDEIIRRYAMVYEAFFDERYLIPPGQFCEVCFEELERDFVGQVGRIYTQLGISGFDKLESKLQQYASETKGYQKSHHKPLVQPIRDRIAQAWSRSFKAWGYAT